MQYPPPSPPGRRQKGRPPQYEFAPTQVVMAHIGASRRRCMTFGEMIEKQAQGLRQLQIECQQMAGIIRDEPERLSHLGEWLHAMAAHLERGKRHLEEQIQIEIFFQGECQRWLSGDPPTELPPPPPGFRRVMPPISMGPIEFSTEEGYAVAPPHLLRRPEAPQLAQQNPRLVQGQAPAIPPERRSVEALRAGAAHQNGPSSPPPAIAAAFAAYQRPKAASPQASTRAEYMTSSPQRLPVVRLPVEQFVPVPSNVEAQTQTNGPSSVVTLEIEPSTGTEDEKTSSPS
jgi:hypothetical protein